MKKIKYLLVGVLFILVTQSFAQAADEIKWMEFEDALELQENTSQKMFLFVYTDWCDFCKMTKETLFEYQPFIDAINQDFIPVKFNAEETKEVQFMGHNLGIQEESGYHYLPIILMDGKMEFPGFIFFNEEGKIISKQSGFKEFKQDFTDYVTYVGSDAYLNTKWLDYNAPR